ncbi:branched-chain amino acid ABC transporter permease [Shinella yambaruensis]|uniref:Branched-chain amino acid ABC transporter permease n=1 Tax=Shinella yambaruensis TaxID=415996 RepID=A0ABQ5ZB33_9HYPH|nr:MULTISPECIES: branched-chain amino acid ABC transporter permease [Shinella]CAI0340456.1 Amino acid/amide ABC transporter membrane protein 1 (HAAT family) [Rhizobiaceae bacterium]CAK7258821.1 branched-chain amino acid transport system permease protein [Shinella sp. WSC3-e]MCJ8030134.1 branched-chain amino acid ABC transporter permease [Shinella yambaruensis]MCO5137272.1 branched-chain amino acid ABC transporter permease [Shinella sp.]MCU7978564.1 branched-chain amino acid ABC transporter per
MLVTALLSGLVLGGTYALVAMGLTLQYGIARIMNLAYGETIIAAAFLAYVLFSGLGINPVLGLLAAVPLGFVFGYLVYGLMMRPLVRRAKSRETLEIDSILATFGLLFVIQGVMLVFFGSNYTSYSYLNIGVSVLGTTIAANRLLAFALAIVLGGGLYLLLTRTLWGTALRAVAVSPTSAPLVGIDVERAARTAFAIGGALAAAGGVVISMYQTFTATAGVVFTMKALIVVIMGGVGNILGALFSGLLLGLVETFVATYVDPGLTLAATYLIFLAILLWRPAGLFGRSAR